MTEKKKKEKTGFAPKGILPGFRIEADGRGNFLSVTFIGILSLKEFSSTEIKLLTKRESLIVCGKKLEISVFENKTVQIEGEIEEIKFYSDKALRRNR